LTELVDAGYGIQAKVDNEDVRILEFERLDTGKFQALYVLFEDASTEKKEEAAEVYGITDVLRSYTTFLVRYNEDEARYRLYPLGFDEEVEGAFELYRRVFIPRM
jgi:hypothetical protein